MDLKSITCSLSGAELDISQAIKIFDIQIPLRNFILNKFPNLKSEEFISYERYEVLLNDYVDSLLNTDRGELSRIELEVIKSIKESEILSAAIKSNFKEQT
ncbi:MAG: hypothetical protein ACK452_10770, partial [Bacteroidota bacterium]